MTKMYLIGETHGGYGQPGVAFRHTIDSDILDRICELADNEHDLNEFIEHELEKDPPRMVGTFLSFFASDMDGKDMREQYKKGNGFGGITEEFCYGVADNKTRAKALFADALIEADENENGDDWDE